MKELKKLKLNHLREADLNSREMSQLKGGLCCGCSCYGPSSTVDNQNANAESGYGSVGGSIYCWCWNGTSWDYENTV